MKITKKIMTVAIVFMMVIALLPSIVMGTTNTPSQIRQHLGVDYTISSWEYRYISSGELLYGWREITTTRPVNVNHFVFEFDSWIIWDTQPGDILLVEARWSPDELFLVQALETEEEIRWYGVIAVLTNVQIPDATEIRYPGRPVGDGLFGIDWGLHEARTAADNEIFGMRRQYTSEHLYWYSTDAISHFHPPMAAFVEYYLVQVFDWFGITPTRRFSVFYYEHEHFLEAYPGVDLGMAFARSGGMSAPVRPEKYLTDLGNSARTVIHELVHTNQTDYLWCYDRTVHYYWVTEGVAVYMEWLLWGRYFQHHWMGPHIINQIRYNNIPTLQFMEEHFWDDCEEIETRWGIPGWLLNYFWAAKMVEFIHETWGFDYVIEIHQVTMVCAGYQELFGITRAEFERQWHRWLRLTFDPTAFHPDEALIGTWDRLATLDSIATFTQSNQRNVNTWARNILNNRGNRHQRLTFNNNGRITATGVAGFGNSWTDGSIGGRGYEIRTIGGNDFLFVNNEQTLATPGTGVGAPWTVFIRR